MRDNNNVQYFNEHDARNITVNKMASKTHLRVAVCVRVSTEHEEQMNALDNQIKWAKDLIDDNKDKWIFDDNKDLYIERGISGTSLRNRKVFNDMITKAKNGEYDLIVVREVCRFMRNAKITLNLVDELLECGVEVFFVNDGIRTRNTDDYFKLTIMAQYAEQESRKVSERVFSGQAIARSNGILFGNGNILGYRHIKGEKSCDSRYEIVEDEAKIVRLIYDLAYKGYGGTKIRNYLNEHGYKTSEGKSKWQVSTIQRILHRATYMGSLQCFQSYTCNPLTHARENVPKDERRLYDMNGKIPVIIEPELWYAVQEKISSRTCSYWNNDRVKTMGTRTSGDVYCRKMRCGCGRRFRIDGEHRYDDAKKNRLTYRCYNLVEDGSKEVRLENSKKLDDNCCIDGIRDWKLCMCTLEVFKRLEYDIVGIRDKVVQIINDNYVNEVGMGYSGANEQYVRKELDALKKKSKRLLDAYLDGVVPLDAYKERKAKMEAEIEELNESLDEAGQRQEEYGKKEKVLKAVQAFVDEMLKFPIVDGYEYAVPDALIDTYVNSIKVCANNIYEYNIRVNPNASVQLPIKPEVEFNPQLDSKTLIIDNSDCVLLGEVEITYEDARNYVRNAQRGSKVVKAQFEKPIRIKIYASL